MSKCPENNVHNSMVMNGNNCHSHHQECSKHTFDKTVKLDSFTQTPWIYSNLLSMECDILQMFRFAGSTTLIHKILSCPFSHGMHNSCAVMNWLYPVSTVWNWHQIYSCSDQIATLDGSFLSILHCLIINNTLRKSMHQCVHAVYAQHGSFCSQPK